jgi:hypothetical protein
VLLLLLTLTFEAELAPLPLSRRFVSAKAVGAKVESKTAPAVIDAPNFFKVINLFMFLIHPLP